MPSNFLNDAVSAAKIVDAACPTVENPGKQSVYYTARIAVWRLTANTNLNLFLSDGKATNYQVRKNGLEAIAKAFIPELQTMSGLNFNWNKCKGAV